MAETQAPAPDAADGLHLAFARVMEVVTWAGLAAMLVLGALYIAGVNPATPAAECAAHWHEPADAYWRGTRGEAPDGYAWFLGDLTKTDNLAVLGVVILAMAPVLSVLAAARHANRAYRVLFAALFLEFVFAVFRPLLMGGGGH